MTKFWEAMAGKLADRWASVAGVALVFWAGGALAVLYDAHSAGRVSDLLATSQGEPVVLQVGLVVAALIVVLGSALMVRRLIGVVLALVQGRWTVCGLRQVANWLAKRAAGKTAKREAEWHEITRTKPDIRTVKQRQRYLFLDDWLRRRPLDPSDTLATPVGNLVQASDARLEAKYGFVPAVVWPRLWLVLPQHVRDELTAARAAVDAAAAAVVWGVAFAAFAYWTVWALVISALVVVPAVLLWLPGRIVVLVDLTESAFDLHRFAVYEQLRLPLPERTDTEHRSGSALTSYLYRGLLNTPSAFTTESKAIPDDVCDYAE